jgi:hypothetical protein
MTQIQRTLVEMGFPPEMAKNATLMSQGSLDLAIEWITGPQLEFPKPKKKPAVQGQRALGEEKKQPEKKRTRGPGKPKQLKCLQCGSTESLEADEGSPGKFYCTPCWDSWEASMKGGKEGREDAPIEVDGEVEGEGDGEGDDTREVVIDDDLVVLELSPQRLRELQEEAMRKYEHDVEKEKEKEEEVEREKKEKLERKAKREKEKEKKKAPPRAAGGAKPALPAKVAALRQERENEREKEREKQRREEAKEAKEVAKAAKAAAEKPKTEAERQQEDAEREQELERKRKEAAVRAERKRHLMQMVKVRAVRKAEKREDPDQPLLRCAGTACQFMSTYPHVLARHEIKAHGIVPAEAVEGAEGEVPRGRVETCGVDGCIYRTDVPELMQRHKLSIVHDGVIGIDEVDEKMSDAWLECGAEGCSFKVRGVLGGVGGGKVVNALTRTLANRLAT